MQESKSIFIFSGGNEGVDVDIEAEAIVLSYHMEAVN
jgi:hypothetical protein